MKAISFAAALSVMPGSVAFAGETASNPGTTVYFVNLQDGDTVSSPVTVVFGLSGMGVAPSGVEKDGTGHHHLFVNRPPFGEGEDGADEAEYAIPADDNHLHFGGGQTETSLDLPTGTHTLQLVLGDWGHVPHSAPIVSEYITISVE